MTQPVIIASATAALMAAAVVTPTGLSTPSTRPVATNFPPALPTMAAGLANPGPEVYVTRPYTILLLRPGSMDDRMARQPAISPRIEVVNPNLYLEHAN